LKRSAGARFMPNAHVFAGGALDANDSLEESYHLCPRLNDAQASIRLNVPRDGLRYFVAAIRESFEEAGLLLAYDGSGGMVDLSGWSDAQLCEIRSRLSAGNIDLSSLCRQHGWHLAPDRLAFFSHWITPPASRRRFDTRFFMAAAPLHQTASLVGSEMSELVWRTPAEALAQHAGGQLLLMLPTHAVLSEMARFAAIDELLDFARCRTGIVPFTPDAPPIQPRG